MSAVSIVMSSAGGLALFLYGLRVLSSALKRVIGERMLLLLEKLTGKAHRGLLVGAATSGILQSSSMTMVLLIGLINAGALSLAQGVRVMLGSEVGTTLTAQIVSFRIGTYYLPVIALGFLLSEIFRGKRWGDGGRVILGFGLLFLGMSIMSGGLRGLAALPAVLALFDLCASHVVLGVAIGAAVTAMIQSSSAMTGLIIALGAADLLTLPAAIALALGANVGTTVTAQIASIGACLPARRLARAQLLFNLIGVLLMMPFVHAFAQLVSLTAATLPRQIANAHTMFNATMAVGMAPFVGGLVWITQRLVPGQERASRAVPEFLSQRFLSTPSVALTQTRRELLRMAEMVHQMISLCRQGLLEDSQQAIAEVLEIELSVDSLQRAIEDYLDLIPSEALADAEARRLHLLHHVTGDVERTGDQAVNIAQRAIQLLQSPHVLSPHARRDLDDLSAKTLRLYERSIQALQTESHSAARDALMLEDEVDRLEREYKGNHLVRLERGLCDPAAGILYVEILHNLERMGDHAVNIAGDVLHAIQESAPASR